MIVGLLILIVVIIFVATLCLTSGNSKYKGEKRGSFDSLQLADGAQVAYELRQSQKTNKMRRYVVPNTTLRSCFRCNTQVSKIIMPF